jgi:hypothetical protein
VGKDSFLFILGWVFAIFISSWASISCWMKPG